MCIVSRMCTHSTVGDLSSVEIVELTLIQVANLIAKNVHNRLLSFEQCRGSLPFAACHHRLHKLQLITFSPLNLHLTPLDHKDQRLKLKSEQPVMSDNLLAATVARWLSNT